MAKAAIQAAGQMNVPICFDGNYRASLWDAWDGDARVILHDLVSKATILIGNHRDVSLLLGRRLEGTGRARRRAAAEAAFEAFPNLELIASTARHVESGQVHRLAARVDRKHDSWQTEDIRIDPIIDRIGTGDAFATGVLSGWLDGLGPRDTAELGLKLAAMKHGQAGDALAITRDEVDAFDPTGADVSR